MSQVPPGPEMPPDDEKLSGTLFGGFQSVANALGGLSTTLTVTGGVGIVLGLILIVFVPDLRLYGLIILGVGAGATLLAMAISFETVKEAVTSRRGRYGTNSVIMIGAFIGIVAVVNFLAFENNSRQDVTATKQFSIAPRTESLLESLNEPVEAKAFFIPGRSADEEALLGTFRSDVDDLLRELGIRSGKFNFEFIDPVKEPVIAREFGVVDYPSIVLEGTESNKRQTVSLADAMQLYFSTGLLAIEQDLVTALLIVTGEEQKHVYFLAGHGERNIDDVEADTEGYGFAFDGATRENYAVEFITLFSPAGRDKLVPPEDAPQSGTPEVNMLVIAGPQNELLAGEAEVMDQYLKNGGRMLFLAESDTPATFREFLARWGIVIGEGHVVDLNRSIIDEPQIVVLSRGEDSYLDLIPELTNGLDTTYYPGLTSLVPAEGVSFFPSAEPAPEEGEEPELGPIVGLALGITSGASWLIEDPERNDPQQGDIRDFFFPAVALRAVGPLDEDPPTLTGTRPAEIVVIGDADFASNRHFYAFNNGDLFLNTINWLVGDETLANIRPKPIAFRQLVLTRNEFEFIRTSSWLLLPALMALMGGFVWWRRR